MTTASHGFWELLDADKLRIWPVTGMLDSSDVIIIESGEGGGQMFTTVLLALAVAK